MTKARPKGKALQAPRKGYKAPPSPAKPRKGERIRESPKARPKATPAQFKIAQKPAPGLMGAGFD